MSAGYGFWSGGGSGVGGGGGGDGGVADVVPFFAMISGDGTSTSFWVDYQVSGLVVGAQVWEMAQSGAFIQHQLEVISLEFDPVSLNSCTITVATAPAAVPPDTSNVIIHLFILPMTG